MKVAIYKDTFANNRGADIAVKNLATGLSERGHAVTLFTKPELAEKVHGDYDVIVSAGTNEIRDLMKFSNLPPIVQQFHTDADYPFRHRIRRWNRHRRIKRSLRKASLLQVLMQTHVAKLQKLLGGVAERKIAVIGNWSAYESRPLPKRPAQQVILYPGAINKDKNQALLVRAFAQVAEDFPGWQVHLYGKGKTREVRSLERLIARHGLSDRVLLKGYADLEEPYASCAFVAFPSKTEGFPLSVIDAAMFSKPALMVQDWIGCGAVTTSRGFATALRKLMSDERYRLTLGVEVRDYCRAHYSRERILSKWEETLCKTINGCHVCSPLVTVIVPACNVEKTVGATLKSLVAQDYSNREILCVDDGSTDATAAVLDAFARRHPCVRVIHKRNRGYGSAINLGLAEAKGEWIAILESDDVCTPKMLSTLVKLGEDSDAHIVKADWNLWWHKKRDIRPAGKMHPQWCDHFLSQKERLELCRISPAIWSALYRKRFLEENDIRCLETPGAAFQDTSFNIKAILACKRLVVTRDHFVNYRQDNPASSVRSKTALFSIVKEYAELSDFLRARPEISRWAKGYVRELEYRAYIWNLKRVDASQRREFIEAARKRLPNYKLFATPEILLRKIESKLRRRERRKYRLFSLHWNANRIELIIRGKTIFYHSF